MNWRAHPSRMADRSTQPSSEGPPNREKSYSRLSTSAAARSSCSTGWRRVASRALAYSGMSNVFFHMAQLGHDLGWCRGLVQHLSTMTPPVRDHLYGSVVFVISGADKARTVVPS